MTALTFSPATKLQAKARIALAGPSGSGKTYTSLLVAQVLGNSIAVIDTEHGSASKYADEFPFNTLALDRYDPAILIDALAAAASAGHNVVIVDSLTHFWSGADGMLEQVDRAAKRTGGGNGFAGWKEMKPTERRMIDAMLAYPGHLIATMRSKTEYLVEKDDRGRSVPRKVGLKPEQRDGIEYEFDVVGDLDHENTLVVSKSRCKALSGQVISRPGESFATTLLGWLDAGEAGPTATELRDAALDRYATREDLRALHAKAQRHGLLGVPVVNEHNDRMLLGDLIIAKGKEAAATVAAADPRTDPAPEPATAPAATEPGMVTDKQHAHMHVLWQHLNYAGDDNRDNRLAVMSRILGRAVETSKSLTEVEAKQVIARLDERKRGGFRA